MKVNRFITNLFEELTYVAWNERDGEALLIDPGMMTDDERSKVADFIDDNHLDVRHILLTHGHLDHIAAALWARERYGARIISHPDDNFLLRLLPDQLAYFRVQINNCEVFTSDISIAEGDTLHFFGEPLRVVHTPGHTPGSVVFHAPDSGLAFTGDTLFAGSVGRTDLAGGDLNALLQILRKIADTLPPETTLLPGHGPHTTLERELSTNLYLKHALS